MTPLQRCVLLLVFITISTVTVMLMLPTIHDVQVKITSVNVSMEKGIKMYYKESERNCLWDYANDSHPLGYYCPCLPTGLNGLLNVNLSANVSWLDVVLATGNQVTPGGEWMPANCAARYRLAVIIPFRDRDVHLRILLRHLLPILQRQMVHFRVFIVEQNSPAIFSRAGMINIGFLEAEKLFPGMNCVMFHDVDKVLCDDRMLMRCDHKVHHYAVTRFDQETFKRKKSYKSYFGGVIAMRPGMFRKVNGFSIVYFGWGREDDDMRIRVRRLYEIFQPPSSIAGYIALSHETESTNPVNPKNFKPPIRRTPQSRVLSGSGQLL